MGWGSGQPCLEGVDKLFAIRTVGKNAVVPPAGVVPPRAREAEQVGKNAVVPLLVSRFRRRTKTSVCLSARSHYARRPRAWAVVSASPSSGSRPWGRRRLVHQPWAPHTQIAQAQVVENGFLSAPPSLPPRPPMEDHITVVVAYYVLQNNGFELNTPCATAAPTLYTTHDASSCQTLPCRHQERSG